jgi:hypothetical protein
MTPFKTKGHASCDPKRHDAPDETERDRVESRSPRGREDAGQWIVPQSTYVQVLGEAGPAGGLALLLVCGDLARGLRRERVLCAGLSGALVSLLTMWMTDYTVRYLAVATTFAVLFGAIAARAARHIA